MKNKKGFTLVEVIAIVLLITVIATLIYPNVLETYRNIKKSTMAVKENEVRNYAKMYISDCMDYDTRDTLSGCKDTDTITSSGHIFLEDLVNDQYMEPVEYEKTECEGYVEFDENDYKVCLRCGEAYRTNDLSCTFDYDNNKYYPFRYSVEGMQTFTVPKNGKYKIELWGAQGGGDSTNIGGYGAYTSGVISLQEGAQLFIYVGGMGGSNASQTNAGGYNGGGASGDGEGVNSYGGGGSTDVRLTDGEWNNAASLASRIMVAAGGGGNFSSTEYTSTAGRAGGLIGYESFNGTYNDEYPTGADQTITGSEPQNRSDRLGSFGYAAQSNPTFFGGGGGGGYYGGVTGYGQAGSGGSSYISGHTGCNGIYSADPLAHVCAANSAKNSNSCSVNYSTRRFSSTVIIDGHGYSWTSQRGSQTKMPSQTYGKFYETGKGNPGDGYARITYIG